MACGGGDHSRHLFGTSPPAAVGDVRHDCGRSSLRTRYHTVTTLRIRKERQKRSRLKSCCQMNPRGLMSASRSREGPAALSTLAAPPVDENDEDTHRRRAIAEVKAYWKTPGVGARMQKGSVTIYTNRLFWWKDNFTNFPLLSTLARPLLAIPAQSERTLSSAGQTLTTVRNRLDPNNLDLLSLKPSWGMSNVASVS